MGTWMAILGAACIVGGALGMLMARAGMRPWMAILGAACIVGGTVGALMVYAALEHNPQEEFRELATGALNYLGLSEIFLSWFVVVSLVAGFVFGLVVAAFRGLGILLRRVRRADRLPSRAR
jgi:hypothetical protein